MPGPTSTSIESAAPSHRRFTVEEANRTLPLVRRIVADIILVHSRAVLLHTQLTQVPSGSSAANALQADLDRAVERLEDYVDELTEIGCELKDYASGLIDFCGRHLGRDVCLCWKYGEPSVAYWHELDAGFAGRQPVETLRE